MRSPSFSGGMVPLWMRFPPTVDVRAAAAEVTPIAAPPVGVRAFFVTILIWVSSGSF